MGPTRLEAAFQFPYWNVGDEPARVHVTGADDYTSGYVRVRTQALDLGALADESLAAGWLPVGDDESAGTGKVIAERDGLLLRAYFDGSDASLFEVRRAAPSWLATAVLAGGLAAAAATWWLTGRLSRRIVVGAPWRDGLLWAALALLAIPMMLTARDVGLVVFGDRWAGSTVAPWSSLSFVVVKPMTLLGLALLLPVLLTTVRSPATEARPVAPVT